MPFALRWYGKLDSSMGRVSSTLSPRLLLSLVRCVEIEPRCSRCVCVVTGRGRPGTGCCCRVFWWPCARWPSLSVIRLIITRGGGEDGYNEAGWGRKGEGRNGGDRNIDILQQHFPLRYNDILINLLTGWDGSSDGLRHASCLCTTNVCPINTTPDAMLATINVPMFNFAN